MPLDLTSLSNSLDSLSRAVLISENLTLMEQYDQDIREIIRAGVVKNFEITYELAYKLLDRIRDFERWITYHKARNASSHEYDEFRFHEIYRFAVQFPHDARFLLNKLRERYD